MSLSNIIIFRVILFGIVTCFLQNARRFVEEIQTSFLHIPDALDLGSMTGVLSLDSRYNPLDTFRSAVLLQPIQPSGHIQECCPLTANKKPWTHSGVLSLDSQYNPLDKFSSAVPWQPIKNPGYIQEFCPLTAATTPWMHSGVLSLDSQYNPLVTFRNAVPWQPMHPPRSNQGYCRLRAKSPRPTKEMLQLRKLMMKSYSIT